MARKLHEIANEVIRDWKNLSPHAKPYVVAMAQLDGITDKFYADEAESVVLYFLSNASGWRGETARRVKAELNEMVRERRQTG